MKLNKIKINNNIFKLYFKNGVFVPTATTGFLISNFLKINKKIKNKKILDLGCGSGIIAIAIANTLNKNTFYGSDLSENSFICCKKNFNKFKIIGEVKRGNMFKPWNGYKFDFIINDISGISSILAKKSKWFQNVPSSSGLDGSKITLQVIKNCPKYLKKKGKLYLPLISLSNCNKILNFAKRKFKKTRIISENKWFLPDDLAKYQNLLFKMKAKKQISFDYKFGKFICYTKILELKN